MTDREKTLADAVEAIRAWLAVPSGSDDSRHQQAYVRAAAAVTLAELKHVASHVLIGNRLRELTGLQVARLIADPELRARALARELHRAAAYEREVQDEVGSMVLEAAEDRGMKARIFEWLGSGEGSRTSRVTIDRWAARVKAARQSGGLPAWLQSGDRDGD